MIDNLLKNTLLDDYGISGRSKIVLTTHKATGIFQKCDPAACGSCKAKMADRANCDEMVMTINAGNNNLIIVEHEEYVKQFDGRQIATGGRCDILICDDTYSNKIMFCELGCYLEKYFEQKKAKARKQTTDSFVRLLNKPSGLAFINQFNQKELAFFRRDSALIQNSTSPQRGDVLQNMQAFITNAATESAYIASNETVNGIPIKFIIVNYPTIYEW